SDPVLTDCRFAGNASEFGGGMACYRSAPSLERCVFTTNAAAAGLWAAGGAIFSDASEPVLRDCSFLRNRAFSAQLPGDGGGVFTQQSSLSATLCVFRENSSGAGGGGFYSFDEDVSILNGCTFVGNSSEAGGGAYLETSFARIIDCEFTGNTADNGGALFISLYSVPELKGCTFTGNGASPHSGGAIDCWQSTLSVEDCEFRGNTATLDGGAFVANGVSVVVFDGCRFLENTASRNGGALSGLYATSVDFLGCTLAGNGAAAAGSALFLQQSGPVTLERSIVAFSVGLSPVACVNTGSVTAACTDLHGNGGGNWTACLSGMGGVPGNLSADPLFCDLAAGDVTILSTSPCMPSNNSCGVLIGAGAQGCLDPTSAEEGLERLSWGSVKGRYRTRD
ncbi:right-handed parallel beta-helix repeat-containing protein, partial [bacterium]|nr:right-handed parallel beta-helix repeat-containing protein [bacterium]